MKPTLAEIVDSSLHLPNRGLMAFVIRKWAIEQAKRIRAEEHIRLLRHPPLPESLRPPGYEEALQRSRRKR